MNCIFALRDDAKAEALELDVLDIIGKGFLYRGVTAQDVVSALRASKAKRVHVRVNSVGGDLAEAEGIREALREKSRAGTKVEVTIMGIAASAATIVTDGGDDVAISKNAFFMIHDASTGTGGRGTIEDHEKAVARLKSANQNLVDMYVATSKRRGKDKTAEDFVGAMKKERYFTATEAIAWGLADRVTDDVRVAACADISALADAPQSLRDAYALVTAIDTAPEQIPPAPVPAAVPANGGKDKSMKIMVTAAVLAALGLKEDAEQAAFDAAIVSLTEQPPALSKLTLNALGANNESDAQQKASELSRVTTGLLAITGASSLAGAVAKVSEWKIGADNAPKLAAKITELESGIIEARREAKIEKLLAEKKLFPSQLTWARTQTAEQLDTYAVGVPAFEFQSVKQITDQKVTLTAEEKDICVKLGITEADYLASKKLEVQTAPGAQAGA